jgi:hypothetical protein
VDTLHDLHARDLRLMQEELDRRLGDLRQLLAERLAAQNAALEKVDSALAVRFESVNEFRKTLSDQTGTFVTRQELTAMLDTVRAAADRNQDRLNSLELRVSTKLEQLGSRQEGESLVGSTRRIDLGLIFQVLAIAAVIVSSLFVAFKK